MQLASIFGAAASLVIYTSNSEFVGLAVFSVCVIVFAFTTVLGIQSRLSSVKTFLFESVSLLYELLVGVTMRINAIIRVRTHNQNRTLAVKVKKTHSESRVVTVLGPRVRKILDVIVDANTLKRVYSELNPNMLKSVILSGVATDLKKLRREAGMVLIISGLVTAVIVLVIVMMERFEILVFAFVIPIITLFYPRIKLKLAASERKHALADEMTFFAVYCLLLAEVGKTVVHALASISGRGVFPALEREARVMERGRGLGMGNIAALGDLGRNHPNRDFGDLLGGYVAAFNAGDPKAHLKSQADALLKKMHKRLEAYKEHSSSLCVMVIFMMFFLPVMITPVAMIAGTKSASFLTQISFLAMPLMTISVCFIAHTVQPKFGDTIRFDWRIPVGLSACAGVVMTILEPNKIWLIMATVSIAFSACSVIMTHKQRRIASAIDKNQDLFFRDITSHVNAGDPSMSHAINKIASSDNGQYDNIFVGIIAHANFRIRHAGEIVQDVLADTARESWLGRFSFFLLSRIADTGSVDAWVLTRTTEFVEKFISLKRDITSGIKLYMIASAVSPIGIIIMTWFLKSIIIGFPASLGSVQGLDGSIGITRVSMTSEFDEAINVLTMASAICANIAVGKISSMSITDLRSLLAGTIIALVGILVAPYFPVSA